MTQKAALTISWRNPLECRMAQYCELDGSIEFIGRAALKRIHEAGPKRMVRGILFDGDRCPPCASPWPLYIDVHSEEAHGEPKVVGAITTAIWSPRFEQNVALAMVDRSDWGAGQQVTVASSDGQLRAGEVVELPLPNESPN